MKRTGGIFLPPVHGMGQAANREQSGKTVFFWRRIGSGHSACALHAPVGACGLHGEWQYGLCVVTTGM
jgi:hypothetical protein